MADHQRAAAPAGHQLDDRVATVPIQIVGRFIQQDQIGLSQHQCRKAQPRPLAATQGGECPRRIETVQSHLRQRLGQSRLQCPVGLIGVGETAVAGYDARQDGESPVDAENLCDGGVVCDLDRLAERADRAGARDGSRGGGELAGDEPQQGGFADAVAPDQACALATDTEADRWEEVTTVGGDVGDVLQNQKSCHGRPMFSGEHGCGGLVLP